MKIVFNALPGELRDYFLILDMIANLEKYIEKIEKDESGERIDSKIKDFVVHVRKESLVDKKNLEKYFKHHTEENYSLADFLYNNEDFWKCKDIEEYISMLENKSNVDKKLYILAVVHNSKGEECEDKLKEICKSDEEILKTIKNSEFTSSLKWDLSCFINDTEIEFKEFIEFIRSSTYIYEQFKGTRNKLMEKLNERLEKNINNNKKSLDFLNKTTRKIVNYDSFNDIYVTTNYGQGYGINFVMNDDTMYIFLGAYYENHLKMIGGEEENRLQTNLMVYKNLCDKNRFEILKLLTKKEDYSQGEIAEILGITNATVSYHMNFLVGANLVNIDKRNKKAFYLLNKNTLEKSIDFIREQLELK